MKKETIIKILFITVVVIMFLVYYGRLYYLDIVKPKLISEEYNIELLDIEYGPYFIIYYGKKLDSSQKCYLIYIRKSERPYIVFEDEGITKQEAYHIVKAKGYKIEYTSLWFYPRNSNEDIKKSLTWRVYYDKANSKYIELNFLSGEVVSLKEKM